MSHRAGCTFGPGHFRIVLADGGRRFVESETQVEAVRRLLPPGAMVKVQRDGYCLDALEPDETGRGVIDGEVFLNMPQKDAQQALGGISAEEYQQAYRAIEDAVLARDRAIAAGAADRPSIVIKKKGQRVLDALP